MSWKHAMDKGEPSIKSVLYKLFEEGFTPGDPEMKATKVKYNSASMYYGKWKREKANQESGEAEILPTETIDDNSDTGKLIRELDYVLKNKPPQPEQKDIKQKSSSVVAVQVKPISSSAIKTTTHVTIVPRAFTMPSTLIWMAMDVAINKWGWPADMTPEQFLDTYLHRSFKQRGATIGGYLIDDEAKGDYWGGNGHHDNGDNEELIENVIGGIEDESS